MGPSPRGKGQGYARSPDGGEGGREAAEPRGPAALTVDELFRCVGGRVCFTYRGYSS